MIFKEEFSCITYVNENSKVKMVILVLQYRMRRKILLCSEITLNELRYLPRIASGQSSPANPHSGIFCGGLL